MVINADKCHFVYLGKGTKNETYIFNNFIFINSNEEKILRITNNSKLDFKSKTEILCKKAAQKLGFYQVY